MANTLRPPQEEPKAGAADVVAAPRNAGSHDYSYRYPRNIVSWFFLAKRHTYVRSILRYSMNLDLGCGPHKITAGSVGADLRREKRPDVVCSVLDLPFADGSFESCTMLEVIEHMDEEKQRRALGEVNRVLADGGQFVISTPNLISGLFRIVWWFWERTYGREWLHEHVGMISTEEVQELLLRLEFSVVSNKRIAIFDRILGAEKRPE